MKRIAVLVMVAAMALVMGTAGGALALGTATVDVSATVVPFCTFNTNGALAFGFLDPSAPADVNGVATQPTFVCSPGTGFTIVDDGGLTGTYTMTSGPNNIPYSFTYTNAGVGNGLAMSMDIAGTVLGADYATALPGIYTDVVTLTITP